jgi:hypothetical protein
MRVGGALQQMIDALGMVGEIVQEVSLPGIFGSRVSSSIN